MPTNEEQDRREARFKELIDALAYERFDYHRGERLGTVTKSVSDSKQVAGPLAKVAKAALAQKDVDEVILVTNWVQWSDGSEPDPLHNLLVRRGQWAFHAMYLHQEGSKWVAQRGNVTDLDRTGPGEYRTKVEGYPINTHTQLLTMSYDDATGYITGHFADAEKGDLKDNIKSTAERIKSKRAQIERIEKEIAELESKLADMKKAARTPRKKAVSA